MREGQEPQPINDMPAEASVDEIEAQSGQRFPTAKELAEKYLAEFNIEDKHGDIRWEIQRAILYERAGRNLSNLGHRISEKLHRPVLALNNPRVGAFYQIGFKHWLENFGSQEKADQFIEELEQQPDYQETFTALNRHTENLRVGLSQLRDHFAEELPEESLAILDEAISSPDPSIDIRLELISSQINKGSRGSRQTSRFFGKAYMPNHEYIEQHMSWLDESLLVIDSLKDKLRSEIFREAGQWLQEGRIKSFVYPVNHWKLSSNGPKDVEIDRYGQHKLYETVSRPETFILFSDAKHYYWRDPEQLAVRSGMRREFKGGPHGWGIGNGEREFAQLIRGSKIVTDALEYPLGSYAPHGITSPQKRLLGIVESDTKVLDVQGLFPDQEDEKWRGSHALESETGEGVIDPSIVMRHTKTPEAVSRVVDDLQSRPEWIKELKSRIPLEANWGYGGPEEA